MTYDAFVSHTISDQQKARELRRAVERYRIPKGMVGAKSADGAASPGRPRLSVFVPEVGANGASKATAPELQDSAFLVVLCSRQSARDSRVDREIRAFKRLGRPNNVLTLILDGEPNAAEGKPGANPADECFAESLKYDLGPDGDLDRSRRSEPIAADARPDRDGRHAVVLKIVAGLLGVGFDDLYNRERRRQQKQLRVVVAASLIVTALLAVLTVRAYLSGEESRRQLASTREVNAYIESLFADVDRPALQKMDSKLMSLILDSSEKKLDQANPKPAPDLEAQMRQILGQAYLACGLWDKAVTNLQRALTLWEPIIGADSSPALMTRRDLGEALIGAGKYGDAKQLLTAAPSSGTAVVRYQLARALALSGDASGAEALLNQEFSARPAAVAEAQQDPAFASIRSALPAPKPPAPASH
jgi:tetratricopeptide (TPR) repeat protein